MNLAGDIVDWQHIDEVSVDETILPQDLMCTPNKGRGKINRFTLENWQTKTVFQLMDSHRQETEKDQI